MKAASDNFKAHLAQECTTICLCWKIVRKDGVEFRFTNHDEDIVFGYIDGTPQVYTAATGFTSTAIENKSDMTVDNLDVTSILDDDSITIEDLRAGLFDYADVYIFLVNWAQPLQLIPPPPPNIQASVNYTSVIPFDTTNVDLPDSTNFAADHQYQYNPPNVIDNTNYYFVTSTGRTGIHRINRTIDPITPGPDLSDTASTLSGIPVSPHGMICGEDNNLYLWSPTAGVGPYVQIDASTLAVTATTTATFSQPKFVANLFSTSTEATGSIRHIVLIDAENVLHVINSNTMAEDTGAAVTLPADMKLTMGGWRVSYTWYYPPPGGTDPAHAIIYGIEQVTSGATSFRLFLLKYYPGSPITVTEAQTYIPTYFDSEWTAFARVDVAPQYPYSEQPTIMLEATDTSLTTGHYKVYAAPINDLTNIDLGYVIGDPDTGGGKTGLLYGWSSIDHPMYMKEDLSRTSSFLGTDNTGTSYNINNMVAYTSNLSAIVGDNVVPSFQWYNPSADEVVFYGTGTGAFANQWNIISFQVSNFGGGGGPGETIFDTINIRYGKFGECVASPQGYYQVEIRGLTQLLQQQIGELYGPACRADLFDNRCGLNSSAYVSSATIATVTDATHFTVTLGTTQGSTELATWFQFGVLRFNSGKNNGKAVEIKSWDPESGAVELYLPPGYPVVVGDSIQLSPGCDKTWATCDSKFSNKLNFRGEANLPGDDAVFWYPNLG